ncbi:MAG: hypothetical protein JW864_08435 [Spirochaetes bacterium]|nr:hypothetical protein [Spirochaetota bacterium]
MKKKLIILTMSLSLMMSLIRCGQVKNTSSDSGTLLEKAVKNIQVSESLNNLKQKNELMKIAESQLKQAEAIEKKKKNPEDLSSGFAYYYFAGCNYAEARKFADKTKNKNDPFIQIIKIRINLREKGVESARESLDVLNSILKKSPRMVMAYLTAGDSHFILGDFKEAQEYYTKVLTLDNGFQVQAADRLEVLSEIRSTGINTRQVQNILFSTALRRCELADVLDRIYKIDKYLKFGSSAGTSFIDISEALYADSIIQLRNKGFFSYIKGDKFEPLKPVTKSEIAMAVEDFLYLKSGNKNIRTRFLKDTMSVVKGIKADDPYYNAVRTALSLKVMDISLDGSIDPLEPVSGLEALHIFGNLINNKKR